MTITLDRRRLVAIAITILATMAILVAYLLGTARSSVAQAAVPAAQPAAQHSGASTQGITVTGTGKVTGTPDSLRLSLAVTATAANVDDALGSANKTMASVQKSLATRGVEPKDMQTSGLSIQPNYTNKGAPDGYAVYENLSATIHDLTKAGATLSAAVAAGGDAVRVDGVSVALDDTSALLGGARSSAMDDAKTKATQYAAAAGRTLGQVISISEIVSTPTPFYGKFAAEGQSSASVPIQGGSQDVSVDVTVMYAFA